MKFIATRTLNGDYGHVAPGETFEVPDWQAKEMQSLEAAGIIRRVRPPVNRKSYVVQKAIEPAENKMRPEPANKAIRQPVNKNA